MIVDSASDDQVYMYDGQHTDETGGDTQIEILAAAGSGALPDAVVANDLYATLIFHLDEVSELEGRETLTFLKRSIASMCVVSSPQPGHETLPKDEITVVPHPDFPEAVVEVEEPVFPEAQSTFCPTCESPRPSVHISVQNEDGTAALCKDPWHGEEPSCGNCGDDCACEPEHV